RFTNVRPDDAKILLRVNVVPNSARPFDWKGMTIYVGRKGEYEKEQQAEGDWLTPGETTPWFDAGRYMMQRGDRSPIYYLSPVLCGVLTEPKADGLHLIAEVARGRGIKLVRRIEVHKPEIKNVNEWEYPWRLRYGTWNGEPPA